MTPEEMLLKAVKERHYNGVRRAFEANANVNATDEAGWTSLHLAFIMGHDNIVKKLDAARPPIGHLNRVAAPKSTHAEASITKGRQRPLFD
jgi:ankyrin repeat protein